MSNTPFGRIGFIGFGKMAGSIVDALASVDALAPSTGREPFQFISRSTESRRRGVERGGSDCSDSPERLFQRTDIVVIAVTPQDLDGLHALFSRRPAGGELEPGPVIVTLLAGISTDRIRALTGSERVCRMIPNIAAAKRRSLVGICFADSADDECRQRALALAAELGTPLPIAERLMPAATGIGGSGLAFAFRFAHALALGGVAEGMTYDQASRAAAAVLDGAAAMLLDGGHPAQLETAVASPGGTTIEGLQRLEEDGFNAALIHAVRAASKKARSFEADLTDD